MLVVVALGGMRHRVAVQCCVPVWTPARRGWLLLIDFELGLIKCCTTVWRRSVIFHDGSAALKTCAGCSLFLFAFVLAHRQLARADCGLPPLLLQGGGLPASTSLSVSKLARALLHGVARGMHMASVSVHWVACGNAAAGFVSWTRW